MLFVVLLIVVSVRSVASLLVMELVTLVLFFLVVNLIWDFVSFSHFYPWLK